MKQESRIRYVRSGKLPDGTPTFDLWAWGRLQAKGIPLDEVIRRILAFEELKE